MTIFGGLLIKADNHNRDMLLSGGFRSAGYDLVHFFTAAHDRNARIPDHGDDIAAMFADIEFLLHVNPSF